MVTLVNLLPFLFATTPRGTGFMLKPLVAVTHPKNLHTKEEKLTPMGISSQVMNSSKKQLSKLKGKKRKRKGKLILPKSKKTQLKQQLDNDSSDNEKIEEDGDSIVLSESDDEDQVIMKKYLFPPISERQTNLFLIDLWKKVNPPVTEESLLNA